MKRLVLIISGILGFLYVSYSERVSESLAKEAAKNFIRLKIQKDYNDLKLAKVMVRNGIILCYYFNFPDDKGYIIIAADNLVHPILGFNLTHRFNDNDHFPPSYLSWVNNYYDQIEFSIVHAVSPDAKNDNEWQCLLNDQLLQIKDVENIDPLLTSTWDQGCYYNTECPYDEDGPCGHALAGCAATAMGQIMKYHNWPPHGTGSHCYIPSSHPEYGAQCVEFDSTFYNWSDMPDNLISSDTNVARLLYHCGVSVDMDYGPGGSGATLSVIPNALINYFSYDPSCTYYLKSDFDGTEWENMLKAELDSLRPVQYRGSGIGSHSFVCDGYLGTNYFHFNWGFGGAYDGYFYLNDLTPGLYNFNNDQAAVMHIKPATSPPDSPCAIDAFTISSSRIDITWENVTGESGYYLYRSFTPDGIYSLIGSTIGNVTSLSNMGLSDSTQFCYKVKAYNLIGTSEFSPFVCAITLIDGAEPWSCGNLIIDLRDGQDYNTIQIGDHCWFQENLNIGKMIINNQSGQLQTDNDTIEKYCYWNNQAICNTYGGLYEWNEAMQYATIEGSQGVCPSFWHIPTDVEWKILEGTVDSQFPIGDPEWDGLNWRGLDAGGNLKETGNSHWSAPNTGATNESGFTCLPGGLRTEQNGSFGNRGISANIWSSSTLIPGSAFWCRMLYYNNAGSQRGWFHETGGLSVRCIKNPEPIDFIFDDGTFIYGDANNDGTVNVLDIITIVNYIMGNNPDLFNFEKADVNNDGVINVLDIILVTNIIMEY